MAKFKNQKERWEKLGKEIMEDYASMQKVFTEPLIPDFEAKPMEWSELKPGTIVPIPVKGEDRMAYITVEEVAYSVVRPMEDLEPEVKKCFEDNGFVDGPVGNMDIKLSEGYKMMIRWDIDLDRKLQPDYQFKDKEGHSVLSPKFDGWLPNGWKTKEDIKKEEEEMREQGKPEEEITKMKEHNDSVPHNSWIFWVNGAYPEGSEKIGAKKRCLWIVTHEEKEKVV